MTDPSDPPEALTDRWFCTLCQVGDVTSCDVDRCCLMCGVDLVSLTDLRSLLSAHGLHIVTDAEHMMLRGTVELIGEGGRLVAPKDVAVLEAMGSRTEQWLLDTIDHFGADNAPAEVAELARRQKP